MSCLKPVGQEVFKQEQRQDYDREKKEKEKMKKKAAKYYSRVTFSSFVATKFKRLHGIFLDVLQIVLPN